MENRWVAVLDGWLHEVAGLWGAGNYTFRLGLCILGVIGRWLFCSGGCLLRFH